jgi:S-adenosylmethionine:tRNA ribosyltransferase-isomerase
LSHPGDISIQDYDYPLDVSRIAQFPPEEREAAKLLVYRQGRIAEDIFRNIGAYLPDGCSLIFNNTRVIRARLNFLNDNEQPIEIFCLEPSGTKGISEAMSSRGEVSYKCLVGNLRRWKQEKLPLKTQDFELKARILEKHEGFVVVHFSWQPEELSFSEIVQASGNMPIPPYLNREAVESDSRRYQTVYARTEGSVAAPTAGLHFTPDLISQLGAKGMNSLALTLHVGAGTFLPVKSEKLAGHEMHAEWIEVQAEMLRQLAESEEKKIIAVGTTSLRTLESLYWMGFKVSMDKDIQPQDLEIKQWEVYGRDTALSRAESLTLLAGWMKRNGLQTLVCRTRILIAPPYEMRVCDGIITNFHQPKSTLLLLIAAFTGSDWRKIYQYALDHHFRFLSYGDSSLLLK